MNALEVHLQKRYKIADLPAEYVDIIKKKQCVNCHKHFDILEGFGIEFAKTSRTIVWWHQPKRVSRGRYYSKQQCPKSE